MRIHWMILALAVLVTGGCGGTPIAQPSSENTVATNAPKNAPANEPMNEPTNEATNSPTNESLPVTPVTPPDNQANGQPQGEPATTGENVERVKAEVGVGEKGRKLDQFEGVIVTPAKAYFSVRERVVFEIQIPQAMNFFQAEHGRFPESHDEFMEKIIAANSIKLPGLPGLQKYVYDPEKQELMVERPRN